MSELAYSGDDLRKRREMLGLRPADVFEVVRIPIKYVEALETGDFDALPTTGYAVGFLRTYCRFLNLPPERYVDSFRASARRWQATSPLPGASRARTASWKEDLLTWAAICAMLLLGWITYAIVVHPRAEVTENRVEAGTREMVVPPAPTDADFQPVVSPFLR